jgi:hypothetical protein
MRRQVTLVLALLALGLALPALGQEAPAGSPGSSIPATNAGPALASDAPAPQPEWGTADWTVLDTSMMGFTPLTDGQWTHFWNGWSYRSGGGNTAACTAVHLPSGALLQYITTWTNDTDATYNITSILNDVTLNAHTNTQPFTWTSSGTPGIENVARAVSPNITINNDRHTYTLCIEHGTTLTTLESAGASFWYLLQVSPQPGTATFSDVPLSDPRNKFVEALYAAGITAGCGGGKYCPDTPLTRGQMAVYLASALGLYWSR